jgi:pilus assembly protein CpaC
LSQDQRLAWDAGSAAVGEGLPFGPEQHAVRRHRVLKQGAEMMSLIAHNRAGGRSRAALGGLGMCRRGWRWALTGLVGVASLGLAAAAEPDSAKIPYRRPIWGGIAQATDTKQPDRLPPPLEGKPQRVPGENIPPANRQPSTTPGRPRLPYLGAPSGLGKPPVVDSKTREEFGAYVGDIIDPKNSMTLVVGRPRLVLLKEVPKRIQIADDAIADHNFFSEKELTLIGKKVGTTVLNLWFKDKEDATKDKILSYLLHVIPDPGEKDRLEAMYKALEREINEWFPDSWVCLGLVGDKLVVTGQAKDIAEATWILRILRANAPDEERRTWDIPANVNVNLVAETGLPDFSSYMLAGGPNVINLLRVPGEQQVNLRVTVAEVNRTAARSIGMNFSIANNQGITVFGQSTGSLVTDITGTGNGQSFANISASLDHGQITTAINALRDHNFARTLTEPNLVTLSGREASFQAGGQFPVPVVTGFTGAGLQSTQFIPFGVQLTFTPYVTDRDRIRLEVSAVVSTRDLEAGTVNIGNTAVPNLVTRNFQTTVEMREGQTFAVAGLIQNNYGARSARVPLLGDLPIIGNMWGFDRSSAGEQELVILVTPELVHPLEPKEVTPLPGSDLFEPGDYEFFVWKRLESRRSYDYRSPVMTDIHRMLRYRHCDQLYILGPCGHTDAPPPAAGPRP